MFYFRIFRNILRFKLKKFFKIYNRIDLIFATILRFPTIFYQRKLV